MITAIAILLIILVAGIIGTSMKIIPQSTTMVIERLGKYHKTLKSGINIVVPFIDQPKTIEWSIANPFEKDDKPEKRIRMKTTKIDLREQIYDYPKQSVITKDNVNIDIDALIYFQITEPEKAVYEISNLPKAIEMLTQTTLRNVLGSMELDESLTSRSSINTRLCTILDEATDKWGVKVTRVEIKSIDPPPSIQEVMEKQMKAEREKRAAILLAEGEKQSAILQAEGMKQAEITKAEGEKEAAMLRASGEAEATKQKAEAEAKAIEYVKAQFKDEKEYSEYLKSIRYIDAMKDIFSGKDVKTVFMPYETQKALGGLGTVGELIRTGEKA